MVISLTVTWLIFPCGLQTVVRSVTGVLTSKVSQIQDFSIPMTVFLRGNTVLTFSHNGVTVRLYYKLRKLQQFTMSRTSVACGLLCVVYFSAEFQSIFLKAKLLLKCNLSFFCECIRVKPSCKSIITMKEALVFRSSSFSMGVLWANSMLPSKSLFLKH